MVLIAIINRQKDLNLLLKKKLYRIRADRIPKRPFTHIAFYETVALGKDGKQIKYFAKVAGSKQTTRLCILPDEPKHPRAHKSYKLFRFKTIKELPRPVKNTSSMRVVFGFASLNRLKKARTLHTLLSIKPLEFIFRSRLRKAGIAFHPEYRVMLKSGKTYRLDAAIFRGNKKYDIECDNPKYHSGRKSEDDTTRDNKLKSEGWTIIRLTPKDILNNLRKFVIPACLKRESLALSSLRRQGSSSPL